jgi:hypothetical protein
MIAERFAMAFATRKLESKTQELPDAIKKSRRFMEIPLRHVWQYRLLSLTGWISKANGFTVR